MFFHSIESTCDFEIYFSLFLKTFQAYLWISEIYLDIYAKYSFRKRTVEFSRFILRRQVLLIFFPLKILS